MSFIRAVCLVIIIVTTTNTAIAQESRVVPLLDLYHSDNAYGGTSANRIFRDGIEIDTPSAFRATPDTVMGLGLIWLNAVHGNMAAAPFNLSPFVRHRRFLDSGEDAFSYGASLSFVLHDGPDNRLDLRTTLARLDASWATGPVDDVSSRLEYRQTFEDGAGLNLGLTVGWRSLPTEGAVSRAGLDARYRNSFNGIDLAVRARIGLRSSDVPGQSGHDAGFGLTLGRDLGLGQAYTRLGVDWSEDDSARSGQPLARNETNALTEIGYAWPLDASGLGRLTIYARHGRSNANLSIYDATTNIVGVGFRMGF